VRIPGGYPVAAALLILGLLAADWATKAAVERHLELGESIRLLPFLNLVHVRNSGMAFSLLADQGDLARWFLVSVSAAVSAVLLWMVARRMGNPPELLAFQVILAGALGNLQGRFEDGFVVDFVDVHAAGWHWPAFNVADSAICVGFAIYLWAAVFPPQDKIEK